MKKCFWLSSYPKSGNTWLRLIICGLYFTDKGIIENFDILKKIPKFDTLDNYQFIKKISNKDYQTIFSNNEFDEAMFLNYFKYCIEAQKKINIINGNFGFFKTHNARVKINDNFYTDENTTAGFIYLSRDPRDIIVSYSDYLNLNYDETIDFIINGQLRSYSKKQILEIPEILLSWENHYNSWKKFTNVPNIFIKFEDLKTDIEKEIIKIINFFKDKFNINLENQNLKIKNIIETTNFNELKKKEKLNGFNENAENKGSFFFRKGEINQWQNKLSDKQKNIVLKKFKNELKQLKYTL